MTNESVPSEPGNTSTERGRGSTGMKGCIAIMKDWIPILKDCIPFVVGILALLGFAWFIRYLLGRTTSAEEVEWTRAVYLLTGVEAIAFAAAGFLFGKDVHRKRAERAEAAGDDASVRANDAENRAAAAKNRATDAQARGEALAGAIKAKAKTAAKPKRAGVLKALPGKEAVKVTQADLEELENLATRLFPDRGNGVLQPDS